jgi:hypothetical protein
MCPSKTFQNPFSKKKIEKARREKSNIELPCGAFSMIDLISFARDSS